MAIVKSELIKELKKSYPNFLNRDLAKIVDIILKEIRLARNLRATHLAITHFDEINNATKLWPILFENGLSPICICNGQNVTGDFSTNIMNLMITKTFPEELYSRGFKHFKHFNK